MVADIVGARETAYHRDFLKHTAEREPPSRLDSLTRWATARPEEGDSSAALRGFAQVQEDDADLSLLSVDVHPVGTGRPSRKQLVVPNGGHLLLLDELLDVLGPRSQTVRGRPKMSSPLCPRPSTDRVGRQLEHVRDLHSRQ